MLYLADSGRRVVGILDDDAGREGAACVGFFSSDLFFNPQDRDYLGQVRIGSSRVCFKCFVFFCLLRVLFRAAATWGASGSFEVRYLRASTRGEKVDDGVLRHFTERAWEFSGLSYASY